MIKYDCPMVLLVMSPFSYGFPIGPLRVPWNPIADAELQRHGPMPAQLHITFMPILIPIAILDMVLASSIVNLRYLLVLPSGKLT